MPARLFVSFVEIKQNVSIPDVLSAFNISDTFQRNGDTLTGVCPLPSHRHGPLPNSSQFKINIKDGVWLWHCFGDCQRGGDVIELVKAVTGYDNAHVRLWFAEKFGDRLTLGRQSRKRDEAEVKRDRVHEESWSKKTQTQAGSSALSSPSSTLPELNPLRFRLDLDPDVPYLRQRGLTPETISRYGLGLCRRGLLKGYVAIPVYGYPHPSGANPLAYLGRWPGDDYDEAIGRPRYKWPEGFPKSLVVYGLPQAIEGGKEQPLIIVEGPFEVYHLTQRGFSNVVATFGCNVSNEQVALLSELGRPVVIMFDGDDAGDAGTRAAATKLLPHCFVRTPNIPRGVTPDRLSTDELVALLS